MDTNTAPMNSQDDVLRFDIGGMTCASCSARVERALVNAPGVTSACITC